MFSQVLFFLIFVTVTSAFLQALDVGDPCQTVGRKGVCTLGDDCPGYSKAIRTQEFLENRCNFRGNQIVVCCPLRKSVEACERHKSRPSKIITFDDHIVNGEEADKGDFPQFVALGYAADNGNMSYDCGGVLISERFVLTAAHCLNRRLILARFGIISMKDDQRANIYKVDMTIKRYIPFPKYSPGEHYDDIGLIELQRPVIFNYNVWPACLGQSDETATEVLQIAGFGLTADRLERGKKSDLLLKADVMETPIDSCIKLYKSTYKTPLKKLEKGVRQTQLCAKNSKSAANTCQGDSGSGLYIKSSNLDKDKRIVVGITSFGVSCSSTLPSFYTRVSKYLDWIESEVWA